MNRDFLFNEIIRRNETKLRKKIAATFFSKVNLDDVYQDVCIHILGKIRNENDENLSKKEKDKKDKKDKKNVKTKSFFNKITSGTKDMYQKVKKSIHVHYFNFQLKLTSS